MLSSSVVIVRGSDAREGAGDDDEGDDPGVTTIGALRASSFEGRTSRGVRRLALSPAIFARSSCLPSVAFHWVLTVTVSP
ncbi:MAG: hypothetical protein DMD76_26280 [Candidatus Rokuibacteriota bacterium]|nr:MAG: hypothetical protein DMD76_26280 [Candidatus Rokubacteria bacterium]